MQTFCLTCVFLLAYSRLQDVLSNSWELLSISRTLTVMMEHLGCMIWKSYSMFVHTHFGIPSAFTCTTHLLCNTHQSGSLTQQIGPFWKMLFWIVLKGPVLGPTLYRGPGTSDPFVPPCWQACVGISVCSTEYLWGMCFLICQCKRGCCQQWLVII